ncbi:MAG: hypothetical protein JWP65_1482 [Ramlibacter sp.]|uniref:hypothetical protein n=1 Tax=Ramlibacter sp. TaxID=1917967 RepID=UPI00260C2B31|nr:hypothetical protein [Ramlibacter sp.]MDB5751061.1 hypothetical protein [Ramlibacter sp.]
MRAIFGVLSLLVVVAVIGVLAKKQLGAGVAPATSERPVPGVVAPAGTPSQQQEQFRQAVEGALQQARPMPDDTK